MKVKRISPFVVLCAFGMFACTAPAAPAAPVAVSISVSGNYKTRYLAGSAFDPAGLIVTATFDNGTTAAVTDYTVSPSGALSGSDATVTVTFGDIAATLPVRVVSGAAKSEGTIKAEFRANKYSTEYNGYEINYLEREPDYSATANDPAPLVLFLHGAGERGNDNEAQVENSVAKAYGDIESMFYDSYVIAPQCPYRATEDGADSSDDTHMDITYTKWVDHRWDAGNYKLSEVRETKALAAVADLVEQYAELPQVDASRVYVVGLSMGGFGTWDIVARHSELFAAAVVMCGGGPSDKAAELADIPVYAFHDTADPVVAYSETSLPLYNAVKAQGKGKMRLVPMQGFGHGIWNEVWSIGGSGRADKDIENDACPRIIDWLFEQSK